MHHADHANRNGPPLAPLRTRLIVFAVLVGIALGAIWLIDARAIERMREYDQQHRHPTPAPAQSGIEAL